MIPQYTLRIDKLEINNFRGFESLTVDFDKNLTIFIGINGSGKTTILDCLVKFLIYFEQRIRQRGFSAEQIPFSKYDIYNKAIIKKTTNTLWLGFNDFENSITMGYETSPQIEKFGSNEDDSLEVQPLFDEQISKIGNEYVYRKLTSLPVMVYYKGQSLSFDLNTSKLEEQTDDSIFNIYEGALTKQNFDFTNFFKWFEKEQKISMQKGNNRNLTFVREAISLMLNDENKYENLQVEWGYPDEMVIYKNGERLIINQLSSGEKNIIALVADLAYRLTVANQTSETPLEGTGIVLIDEIDLHLHPKWQSKVVTKLREIFPNVQLVITTHSLLVLNHIHSKHIFSLDNGKVYSVSETEGQSSEVILEDVMHTPASKYKKDFDLLYEYVTQNNLEKAREQLRSLEAKIEGKHPEIVKINNLLKRKELLGQ